MVTRPGLASPAAKTGRAVADVGANAPSSPVVLKIGGRALETPGELAELAAALAPLAGNAVLVHGGGSEVSAWSERLGLEPRFVEGRRVTDAATLAVAVAVLAGLANKRLVAALRAGGIDAVGLAALDGGVVEAGPHPDAARLGAVGTVTRVSPGLLAALLSAGRVPVLASIGRHGSALLNLNADDLAAALAAALGARALILLSDTPGVVLDGAVTARLAPGEARAALAGPDVTGGMRAKLEAANAALAAGVPVVHVAAWEGPETLGRLLEGQGGGTTLVAAEARS
jgi:acetylglutamate kinase